MVDSKLLGARAALNKTLAPGKFQTKQKNKYVNQMIDLLFGPSKTEAEEAELFRALNESFHMVLTESPTSASMKDFLRLARAARSLGKLGFFLRDFQRLVDLGCGLERSCHWAYSDVLNFESPMP